MVSIENLFGGIEAGQRIEDLAIHGIHGTLHALAAVAVAAVAFFMRFVGAGRRAGWHRSAALGAAFQRDIDFDRRVAAAVENFTAQNIDDGGHGGVSGWSSVGEVVTPRSAAA